MKLSGCVKSESDVTSGLNDEQNLDDEYEKSVHFLTLLIKVMIMPLVL